MQTFKIPPNLPADYNPDDSSVCVEMTVGDKTFGEDDGKWEYGNFSVYPKK